MTTDETWPPVIRIAAALIDDGCGRLLLVRKAGTAAFMQAGGKIEQDETPLAALRRELNEELGFLIDAGTTRYLGRFTAEAANEPGHLVEAELFHIRTNQIVKLSAEIAELVWADPIEASKLELAPLTRTYVLALAPLV